MTVLESHSSWKKWLPWLGLGFVLWAFFTLRQLYAHISFFIVDEAVSAVVGEAILNGGMPYREAVDHRGPLTYYFYAAIFRFWGVWNMYAVHQVYVWLQMGLLLMTFGLGVIWKNRVMGVWAAALLAFHIYASPFYELWPAHTEWLLSFFATLAYLIYLLAPGKIGTLSAKRLGVLLLVGFFFGTGALSKQVGALEAGGIGLYLLLEVGIRQGKWKSFLGEVGVMLIGFLTPLMMLIGHFAANEALEDLWLFGWYYNTEFYVPAADLLTRIDGSAKMVAVFGYNKAISFALLFAGIWLLPWKSLREREQPVPLVWILVGWTSFSFVEALIGGRPFAHYMIQFLVPMSLLCGWLLMELHERVREQKALVKAGFAGAIIMLVLPIGQHWSLNSFMMVEDTSIPEYVDVSHYVRDRTELDDRIFVWGFSPQIYLLAERKPATRFSFTTILVGYIPAVHTTWETAELHEMPEAWDRFWQDVETHPPAYIIEDPIKDLPGSSFRPELTPYAAWRDQYYVHDTVIVHPELNMNYDVWRRK